MNPPYRFSAANDPDAPGISGPERRKRSAWRAFVETLPDNYLEIDRDGRILYITRVDPSLTLEALAQATIFDFLPPDRHDEIRARIERVWISRQAEAYSTDAILPDGIHCYRATLGPVEEEGEVTRLAILSIEITTEKRMAASLAESETRFRAFLDHSPSVMFLKGVDGRYLLVNQQFLRLKGFRYEDVVGKTDADLFDAEDAAAFTANDKLVLERGVPITMEEHLTIDGVQATYLSNKFPVRDASGKVVAVGGVATDLTERTRLERQIQNASKLHAIGQLAGGLAHDFNNLFMGVLGNAELLVRDLAELGRPELLAQAAAIAETTRRATGLTRQLLAFTRRSLVETRHLDMHRLIEEVAALLAHSIGPEIRVSCRLEARHPRIRGEAAELQNALLNLAVNARDAMPRGGSLEFATRDVTLDPGAAGLHQVGNGPGRYLAIEVRDTGTGIPPEIMDRVFEPFFSTKDVGQGSGLGLPAVHGTLSAHHGGYQLESTPGVGTTFTIFLPSEDDKKATDGDSVPATIPIPGEGTVLLVEDDEGVHRVASAFLKRLGYRSVGARDGSEAIRVLEAGEPPVDLVVLDLVMPGMSGAETLAWLRANRPQLPVLVSSGIRPEFELPSDLLAHCRGFVPKPFDLAGFSRHLALALGRLAGDP